MKSRDELQRENEALRGRISRLSAAVLRITASLDVNTVLNEVVESACALTGAGAGAIMTIDEAGQVEEHFILGITPEENRALEAWPYAWKLFEHLRQLPGPVRLADLPSYLQSLGYSSPHVVPSTTMLGTQMRHRDVHIGGFFLGAKEGGRAFTSEDEEVLVLFATQAAAAVANARQHRDEQRARADLEALIDTSPVGVVVFDGRTGHPASLNREARRMVANLQVADGSPEELLEVITCRRADGREVSLAEFPIARQLTDSETVRAEEMVLSTPDGRSLRTLVNATPIRSEDGDVESLIVTLQDLAPLDELERSRAEFLSMVSHELRAPLTSIKGSTATALGATPPPDPAEVHQILRIIDEQADHMRGLINDLLDAGRIEAGTLSITPEPADVAGLVDQARSTFLSGGGRHALHIDLPPDLPRVMAHRQRIVQVLSNLLSNASRHAPASAPIGVAAERDGVHVAVSVTDEGPGVAPHLLPHLFEKGRLAGRDAERRAAGEDGGEGVGLGLVICRGLVEAHGGRIWAESGGAGRGTRFTFTVPVADEAGVGAAAAGSRASSGRTARPRILVVDDDPQTLRYVRDALTAAGYVAVLTGDPRELPRLVRTKRPRLVLLDLMLPGTDGIELMERAPELAGLPVIFISGYRRDETIVKALRLGAADYIVKPFSPTELTARVQAVLRRQGWSERFRLGDLAIDYEQRRVTMAGRAVELTATEYELLRVLSVNATRVLTYDSLLRKVWRGESGNAKLVRAMVKKLRRKLGDDAAQPGYILTERGVGYRLAQPTT